MRVSVIFTLEHDGEHAGETTAEPDESEVVQALTDEIESYVSVIYADDEDGVEHRYDVTLDSSEVIVEEAS